MKKIICGKVWNKRFVWELGLGHQQLACIVCPAVFSSLRKSDLALDCFSWSLCFLQKQESHLYHGHLWFQYPAPHVSLSQQSPDKSLTRSQWKEKKLVEKVLFFAEIHWFLQYHPYSDTEDDHHWMCAQVLCIRQIPRGSTKKDQI